MKTKIQRHTVSSRSIQAAQKSSRMNFTDNRPRAIAQAKMINAIKGKTIQRYVCLLKEKFTDDYVENASIDYALKRAGEPLVAFPDSNFSTIPSNGNLYFVGHGRAGQAGSYSTDMIANRLIDPNLGLKHDNINIKFTSCYAGKDSKTGINNSVIDTLKAQLNTSFSSKHYFVTNWLKNPYRGSITGAMGPSIKSNETGDEFFVVNEQKNPIAIEFPHNSTTFKIRINPTAFDIQKKVESDFIKLKLMHTPKVYIEKAANNLESGMKPSTRSLLANLISNTPQRTLNDLISDILKVFKTEKGEFRTSNEKVGFITAFTTDFYPLLIDKLYSPNPELSYLLPANIAMKTV